ncbi:aspartate kinase, partial [Streptococcus pneumoniae]|nr:aspartate kinase [Streptococcus pneumoniae]
IIDMKCERLEAALSEHDVVVVAGFQGAAKNGDVTTIGRGGSDTSAAALGAALQADFIDIFTDVEGVMTADPRIVENAKPLRVVTYTEICNLAY